MLCLKRRIYLGLCLGINFEQRERFRANSEVEERCEMSNIAEMVANENLSLEELGQVVNEALAKIYVKLREEVGMYDPVGVIKSLGENSYNVEIVFIDGETRSPGESYESIYYT